MAKRVLIVGAGYAGIEAALTLNRRKKKNDLEITLIDKNDYHTLLTELHEVAGNRISEEGIRIPLRSIFKYTNVNLVLDEITSFDLEHNRVASVKKQYEYDYLILAMGSTPNFFGIPGLKENAFTLWSFDDAVRIREHIKKCFTLASQEKDKEARRRFLTFVVAGAGFTGVEMIGELAIWVRSLCKEYKIDRKEVRLTIVDMLPRILNNLKEHNSSKAHKYLERKLHVEVMLNTKIKEATEKGLIYEGGEIEAATVIWAAGIKASEDADSLKIEKLGGPKRLKVDEFCRTEYKNVYSVGDLGGLADEAGRPYAAMVENAIQTAHGAAENIINQIRGKEQKKVTVKFHGTMVSVGNYFCVAEIMNRSLPVWLSVIMKFMVNIHYLWEITGFRGISRYLYHEVLERKQRKMLVEQHWSTRLQAWWLTPLRLFLGGMWLYEGIVKVTEGWLLSPKLAQFLGMATDATSAASGNSAYVTRVDDIIAIKTGLINFFLGTESRLVDGVSIASQKLVKVELFHFGDFSLIPWFLQHVVLVNDAVAMFFQVLVVVFEILVGLMLLGGAFTFLGSLISVGLLTMFITSTGLYQKDWWMIFAGIATMGGAGRAFGLDYYLIPYLNNVWESYWKNKKIRLFFKRSLDRFD
ncbi:MAG: NAD(P)/FAD-dependent oxidoreductase [Clostridia bacterium]|nr:NAD(P)/FAD-dependent oxidoreductase [Clostridia bacterium]